MGKYDSSRTRVVPVFNHLLAADRTGRSWIGRLVSLPTGGRPVKLPDSCDLTLQEYGWGTCEKKLEPPVSLLSWLIRHPRSPVSGLISSDPVKDQKRREWIAGSEARILEGLALLRDNSTREDWHLFEGETQPDVFLLTPDVIVVIEGKRTERQPTISTTWMTGRHQMLRHIDCALETAANRRVVGFFIVEGRASDGAIPEEWLDYALETVAPQSVLSSLPHRGPEEQKTISDCFAGVTTWQLLCAEFDLPLSLLAESVSDEPKQPAP